MSGNAKVCYKCLLRVLIPPTIQALAAFMYCGASLPSFVHKQPQLCRQSISRRVDVTSRLMHQDSACFSYLQFVWLKSDQAFYPCAAQPGTMVRISVLNDALKSMFNAEKRGKRQVLIKPSSKVIIKFLSVMQKHGECGNAQLHFLCSWYSHCVRSFSGSECFLQQHTGITD